MTEDEVIEFVVGLPGTIALTAGADNGAPEVAWGDTFFFYDPDGDTPDERRFPFATIVTKDYDGFDTTSRISRPEVFRLNIAVGRQVFQGLFGYQPAAHIGHEASFDFSALDLFLPHPVYAVQGWACILNPTEASGDLTRSLLTQAQARAAQRYRRSA